jgi:hypothetical protein
MTMITSTFSANERARLHSLTALALLADPVSVLFGTCDQNSSLCVAGLTQLGDIYLRALYHAVGCMTGPELQPVCSEFFYQHGCEKLDALIRLQLWLVEPAGRA